MGQRLHALSVLLMLYNCLNYMKFLPPARCVFADSWFASVSTALALREHLGVHFTGPIKTAHNNFPIEAIRHTLAKMNRGDHITLKCEDVDNLWAVGWHDHHYKCYVTTHGVTKPVNLPLKGVKIF